VFVQFDSQEIPCSIRPVSLPALLLPASHLLPLANVTTVNISSYTTNSLPNMVRKLVAVLLSFKAALFIILATPQGLAEHTNNNSPCTCRKSATGRFCGSRSTANGLGKRYLKGDRITQNVYRCTGIVMLLLMFWSTAVFAKSSPVSKVPSRAYIHRFNSLDGGSM